MPRARSAGEGGIWQEKTGKHAGRWRGAISIPTASGLSKRVERYGKTRKEVVEKLDQVKKNMAQGVNLLTKSPTLAQFLDSWMSKVIIHRKPTTSYRYAQVIRLEIAPLLGSVKLDKLNPDRLQMWINALQVEKTAHVADRAGRVLSRALNVAVKWGLIPRNPMASVELPHISTPPIIPLSQDQAVALLEAVKGHRLEALYSVALALGLRKGEIIALRWDDIDWKERTLRIDTTISRLPGKTHETRPKTDAPAVLPLPPALVLALRNHQQYQKEEAALKEDTWQDHGFVFASEVGTALNPRNLVSSFKRLLKRAGLPETIRFHDLRHSCATLLIAQGVHMKVVQSILRHQRIDLTMNLYGHVYEETQRDAVGGMFDELQKGRKAE